MKGMHRLVHSAPKAHRRPSWTLSTPVPWLLAIMLVSAACDATSDKKKDKSAEEDEDDDKPSKKKKEKDPYETVALADVQKLYSTQFDEAEKKYVDKKLRLTATAHATLDTAGAKWIFVNVSNPPPVFGKEGYAELHFDVICSLRDAKQLKHGVPNSKLTVRGTMQGAHKFSKNLTLYDCIVEGQDDTKAAEALPPMPKPVD